MSLFLAFDNLSCFARKMLPSTNFYEFPPSFLPPLWASAKGLVARQTGSLFLRYIFLDTEMLYV